MSGDVKRLPKWAQAEMRRLEMRAERAEDAVARLVPSDKTAVVTDPYGHHGGTVGVAPRGEYVRFAIDGLDGHAWLDVRVNHEGTGVDLMAAATLRIECRASNTAGIEVRRP